MAPPKKGKRTIGKVEAQVVDNDDDEVGLPKMVARMWALVSGISYISNGGYLVAEVGSGQCKGAGGYMIVVGLFIIIFECACCLCPVKNNLCERLDKKIPYWLKGLLYMLLTIPVLALCFGVKTLISSVIVIMLGLIYIFLTCLTKSKKYERLQGEARQRYQDQKKNYNTVSTASNVITSLKQSATQLQVKDQRKDQRRQHRPKKYKQQRNNTSNI